MRTPVKNFHISAQEVSHVAKTAKMGTFEGVLGSGIQLKQHNFG